MMQQNEGTIYYIVHVIYLKRENELVKRADVLVSGVNELLIRTHDIHIFSRHVRGSVDIRCWQSITCYLCPQCFFFNPNKENQHKLSINSHIFKSVEKLDAIKMGARLTA